MADGPVNVCLAPGDLLHLLQFNRDRGRDYQGFVSDFVSEHKGKSLVLGNPAGAKLTIGDLSDTIYRDKPNEVNGWGKFYLPKEVSMQVLGVVEETSCPCDQLVLMTCEDRKLYAYDGEELHQVASSLKQLGEKRIEYPASTSYYNGEAFKDMTEKDWAKVREGAVGRSLDQAHHKLVTAQKSRFLQNLKIKCEYFIFAAGIQQLMLLGFVLFVMLLVVDYVHFSE